MVSTLNLVVKNNSYCIEALAGHNAKRSFSRASAITERAVATLSLMQPAPSAPNISPSLSARWALLMKVSTSASWQRLSAEQSSHTRNEASGRIG